MVWFWFFCLFLVLFCFFLPAAELRSRSRHDSQRGGCGRAGRGGCRIHRRRLHRGWRRGQAATDEPERPAAGGILGRGPAYSGAGRRGTWAGRSGTEEVGWGEACGTAGAQPPPGRAGGPALGPAARRGHAGGRHHAPDSAGRGRRRQAGGRLPAPTPPRSVSAAAHLPAAAAAAALPPRRGRATCWGGRRPSLRPSARSSVHSLARSLPPSLPPPCPSPNAGAAVTQGEGPEGRGEGGGGECPSAARGSGGAGRSGEERSTPAPRFALRYPHPPTPRHRPPRAAGPRQRPRPHVRPGRPPLLPRAAAAASLAGGARWTRPLRPLIGAAPAGRSAARGGIGGKRGGSGGGGTGPSPR